MNSRPIGWLSFASRRRACAPRGLAIAALTFLLPLLPACGPTSFLITPVSASPQLEEHVLQRESIWASKKVALLDVDGVLSDSRPSSFFGPSGENPVSVFKEKLDKAADDKHVVAVVLRINSPGGGVTASDLMYSEIQRFRQKTGKPVIACMLDVAASGGYYIACAADRIFAHPTTITGSIGVIMMAPDLSGAMTKLGIRANVIKSGELKDAGSPFREMSDADRAVFQGLIDQMYSRFVDVVALARTQLSRERIAALANGRVYLAPDAKAAGLVDEIGSLADAIAAAKAAAGLRAQAVIVVQYAVSADYRPNVYARAPQSPAQVNLIQVQLPGWLGGAAPEFMYLWAPGW